MNDQLAEAVLTVSWLAAGSAPSVVDGVLVESDGAVLVPVVGSSFG